MGFRINLNFCKMKHLIILVLGIVLSNNVSGQQQLIAKAALAILAERIDSEKINRTANTTIDNASGLNKDFISFVFEKLKDFETPCNELPVKIAVSTDFKIDSSSFLIYYSTNYKRTDSVNLSYNKTTKEFIGTIPLNNFQGRLIYYFSLKTKDEIEYKLPCSSTNSVYELKIGPDLLAPTLQHNPEKIALKTNSSIDLSVLASDNIGINKVNIEYMINGYAQKPLELINDSANYFSGKLLFPKETKEEDKIEYRIVAEDKSVLKNIKTSPEMGFYSVSLFSPLGFVTSYFNDFNTSKTDFILSDFYLSLPSGFNNGILQTQHPYPVSAIEKKHYNLIAQLKYPILIEENGLMKFDEIVLVEPSKQGAVFNKLQTWDFVIVEGSKDNGITWLPFAEGYDSQTNDIWNSQFTSSVINNTSVYFGQNEMFENRTINLTNNKNFNANDTVLIRFRLSSDITVNGWGWAIDNLSIQESSQEEPEIKQEIVSKEKFTVFPNPFQNNLNIYYTGDSVESETISISDITGKTVYTETWSNVNPGTKQEMNLNALKPGIYFIKITDLKLHIITKKVIKN
jgi:hypothetical protein